MGIYWKLLCLFVANEKKKRKETVHSSFDTNLEGYTEIANETVKYYSDDYLGKTNINAIFKRNMLI